MPTEDEDTLEDEVRKMVEQGKILSEELRAIQSEASERTAQAKDRAQKAIERRERL